MNHVIPENRKPFPTESNSALSNLFFLYALRLFKKIHNFKKEDLFAVPSSLKSKKLEQHFDYHWNQGKENGILYVMCNSFGYCYLGIGFMKLLAEVVLLIFQSHILGKLLSCFSQEPSVKSVFYISLWFAFSLVETVFVNNYTLFLKKYALRLRASLSSFVFIRLFSYAYLNESTTGKVITLLTKDFQVLENFVQHGNDFWISITKLGVVSYILYQKCGPKILLVLSSFVVLIPIQIILCANIAFHKYKMLANTEKRIQASAEFTNGTEPTRETESRIYWCRKEEIKSCYNIFKLRAIAFMVSNLSSRLTMYIFIILIQNSGFNLTTETESIFIHFYLMLSECFKMDFPWSVLQISETLAVLQRLDHFMKEPQQNEKNLLKMSYVPKKPWLFHSTIRQNIIFGLQFEPQRYEKTLETCNLYKEVESLEEKDLTIVLNNGINLSETLRTKISLARAVYQQSDAFVLKDIIPELDETSQKFIYNCIIKVKAKAMPHNFKKSETATRIQEQEKEYDFVKCSLNIRSKKSLYDEDAIKRRFNQYKAFNLKKMFKNVIILGGGSVAFLAIFGVFVLTQMERCYITSLTAKSLLATNQSNVTIKTNAQQIELHGILILVEAATVFLSFFALFLFTRKLSNQVHEQYCKSTISSLTQFLQTASVSSILNRYSRDLTTLDETIPFLLNDVIHYILDTSVLFILIGQTNLAFLIVTLIVASVLFILRQWCISSQIVLKNWSCKTFTPILSYVNDTICGLSVIKAAKVESKIKNEFNEHLDLQTCASYAYYCMLTTFSFLLDVTCIFCVIIITAFLCAGEKITEKGMLLTQTLLLMHKLKMSFFKWTELENNLVSLKRLLEYVNRNRKSTSNNRRRTFKKEALKNIYQNV